MKIPKVLVSKLEAIGQVGKDFAKKLSAASIITEAFIVNGLEPPVLVGGSAVEIYTNGEYGSHDSDFISRAEGHEYEIIEALGYRRYERHHYNPKLDSLIEFPVGPLAGDNEKICRYFVEETGYNVYFIGIEDLILDRIDSASTGATLSGEWATRLMTIYYDILDWSYLHKESHRRGTLSLTERVQRQVKGALKEYSRMRDETSSDREHGTEAIRMNLF